MKAGIYRSKKNKEFTFRYIGDSYEVLTNKPDKGYHKPGTIHNSEYLNEDTAYERIEFSDYVKLIYEM